MKTKFRFINNTIESLITKTNKDKEREAVSSAVAVETKQWVYKTCVNNILKEVFTFRGVWRNKAVYDNAESAARGPCKLSNKVTWSFMKPILWPCLSYSLEFYNLTESDNMLRRESPQDHWNDNWVNLKL